MKLLLYCTKAKPILRKFYNYFLDKHTDNYYWKKGQVAPYNFNGKIVAECDYEVDRLSNNNIYKEYVLEHNSELWENDILTKSCLTYDELNNYLSGNGYAIHIKNLHIFDEPKKLSEYYSIIDMGGGMLGTKPLIKAPQNMMSVSSNQWEYCFYNPNDINILISIRPEWLCKILNGEKTIEVRKKVLKEMIR